MVVEDIGIILVEPSVPENIGFTARSMKVFGFKQLYLVNPPDGFLEIAGKTGGCASEILNNCIIYDTFNTLRKHFDFLIATTRRMGTTRYPVYKPEEIAVYLNFNNTNLKTGIVFGRENFGLYNSEIEYCRLISNIPSAESGISLNVSHAVTIYLNELYKYANNTENVHSDELPDAEDIFCLRDYVFDLLKSGNFIKYGEESLKNDLTGILKKSALGKKDIKLLKAICYHFKKEKFRPI